MKILRAQGQARFPPTQTKQEADRIIGKGLKNQSRRVSEPGEDTDPGASEEGNESWGNSQRSALAFQRKVWNRCCGPELAFALPQQDI